MTKLVSAANGKGKRKPPTNGGNTEFEIDISEKEDEETGEKVKYFDLATVPEGYKVDGRKIVKMHLVNRPEDCNDSSFGGGSFHPLFIYQFFDEPHDKSELDQVVADDAIDAESEAEQSDDGEINGGAPGSNGHAEEVDENEGLIIGYNDLEIDLAFTPATLKPFIRTEYSNALPVEQRSTADFTAALEEYMGHKVMTTSDALARAVKEDQEFKPFGTKIQEWKLTGKDNIDHRYELFEVGHNSQELGYPSRFPEYLAEIQPFLAWFIYASTFIQADDTKWLHYFLYENVPEMGYRLIGYCSVYRYFMMAPRKNFEANEKWTGEPRLRCRIGQFLILPPYQKRGIGARMLHEIILSLQSNPKVYEISVEDPQPEFQRLFKTVTSKCLKEYLNHQRNSCDVRIWVDHLPPHILTELRKNLKFSKKDVVFCTDVIASEVARVEGGEALKQFHKHLADRIKRQADQELELWRKTLLRVKGKYYAFGEDLDASSNPPNEKHLKLAAIWQSNLEDRIAGKKKKASAANLGVEIHELAARIHEVAKRMDRLDF